MKKLILSELLLLFLATTFMTDSLPPGWFQQSIPIGNKTITDIQFLDSLNGWVVTNWGPAFDTAYIFKTSDGGTNWGFQLRYPVSFTAICMTDMNTGYASGGTGFGRLFKTTSGGVNWSLIYTAGHLFNDVFFVNKDTGWICDDDAAFGVGIMKTINGGANWFQQAGSSYRPQKLFFINKDTGWAGSSDWKLYRTTNGGQNWGFQYTSNGAVTSIFFLNGNNGLIKAGTTNGVQYTTDGGFNWTNSQGTLAGYDMKFINDSVGYSGSVPNIAKSTDGGKTWGYQLAPSNTYLSIYALKLDTLHGWAGTYNFIRTTDGGGPITFTGIHQISSEMPSDFKLYQNYPNPFNPRTVIKYQIVNSKEQISNVKLIVFDIQGREITTLVNEKQSYGTYEVDFSGNSLSSGVYFYKIIITAGKEVFSDVKKMVLLK